MSNKEFALTNKDFLSACLKADTPATKRQASKWRNNKGKAWKEGR